ncbi:MAG TPA: class I SAM-dependent methyltransferase, partial [Vicinamibacterales bacterium]|nr:class I SAM-dependent methyltransferase [Vicinamibacterales bacterium]
MARSDALTRTIAGAIPSSQQVCVLDLATGTGSNIRYLVDRLPGRQRWLAVDRDATLLADLRERMSSWGAARGYYVRTEPGSCIIRSPRLECEIKTRRMD